MRTTWRGWRRGTGPRLWLVWAVYLADMDGPTLVAPSRDHGTPPSLPARLEIAVPAALLAGLQDLARGRNLTLNTVVQGLWALVLEGLTGQDDIVFGVTVSGRPAELPGVERMVGLLINTVPLRVRLRPGDKGSTPC